jgi:hypothetical protein
MMVTRWIGKTFKLRDGDVVTVRGVRTPKQGMIVLDLEGRNGKFNLTRNELEANQC